MLAHSDFGGAQEERRQLMEQHIFIHDIHPALNCGRYPIKRVVNEPWTVQATIFRDGADIIRAMLRLRPAKSKKFREVPMVQINAGLDLWQAELKADAMGAYRYSVVAWTDTYATWVREMSRKITAGLTRLSGEISEGKAILLQALDRANARDRKIIDKAVVLLDSPEATPAAILREIEAQSLMDAMLRSQERADLVTSEPELEVWVDRPRARFSTWYEFFPRSESGEPGKHGTFRDAERRLPYIQDLGFDVVYLPPIHPIGVTHRKGRNNAVVAAETDPGSPWAIGNADGGHDAIEPQLGTVEDFDHFVAAAAEHGIEIALDFAIQASPDHPWVRSHPEFFQYRPDGTIKYAENPPKKYEDIHPINFDTPEKDALWKALKDVLFYWIEHGVRIFRVDNPHTKPFVFWEWVIKEVHREHPDVLFLAEAFSRPAITQGLAKIGFSQSYTYFTWRNTKWELTEYLTELTQTDMQYFFRPNFFANTPDILTDYLVHGGRPAFMIRAVLAGTLSPSYGIYSGFEFCENEPMPGKEEYNNNEKYELKHRDWQAEGNIQAWIRRINQIRQQNPALQALTNIHFFEADNDNILFYAKVSDDGSNILLVVVNLDPYNTQEATVRVALDTLAMAWGSRYEVHDLLSGERYFWGEYNFVRLNPAVAPAHILRIEGVR